MFLFSNTAQEDLSYSPQKASLNQQPSVSSSAMESQDISHQSSQQMQSRVMEGKWLYPTSIFSSYFIVSFMVKLL